MNKIVLLDSGPLSLATNPKKSAETIECAIWLEDLSDGGVVIRVPEIVDYELRRELLRAGKSKGIKRLDALIADAADRSLPITTAAMRLAAQFWADARNRGIATAPDREIDADMILAAQAAVLNSPDVVIATTNVGHLSRFVAAEEWRNIRP